ncbi:T9SS type A sorting domain-containing protein [Aequorivita marisscotiae]|uniref:T9SS type A sorting domain-containing protein n=1 Tax=Aequorivita marisscotiae TaxID=3040348 RepID=A0ABY8KXD8_9FLAO|nr:T9SS type A sorting domain-containing protein [Aequorivita sp. Ant34-E75]WGF93219.1 T9SS type A sorting domain-containing protein [Aequorivita sp. Ant34-E75]
MKKTTAVVALLLASVSFAQVAGTSFEEPDTFTGKYTDTGDPNIAHDLINNASQPLVDFASMGGEMGFDARYTPYDSPGVGLSDGDDVGVTDKKPSSEVPFTAGENGYRMSDIDGNYILEFDQVDLTGVTTPAISVDFLIAINSSNPANGNYEGDGTTNESGSDRLRIYVKDITNSTEIDLFNSTGTDLDDLVPFNTTTGQYELSWQNVFGAVPSSVVQLVIEGRNNAGGESFWFDNVMYVSTTGVPEQSANQFNLFPNPATKGVVNIRSATQGIKNISIYDVLGKLVLKTALRGEILDISKLNSGVYIFKIEQGNHSATKKLVVN